MSTPSKHGKTQMMNSTKEMEMAGSQGRSIWEKEHDAETCGRRRNRDQAASARKKTGLLLREARLPSVLLGPVHPVGSSVALSVPPSERLRPTVKMPATTKACRRQSKRRTGFLEMQIGPIIFFGILPIFSPTRTNRRERNASGAFDCQQKLSSHAVTCCNSTRCVHVPPLPPPDR
jgi:hypothetical protein